ncbi:MAG: hypothetical protein RI911_853, partial [Candidatus Parcubacteria bacterium]
VRVMHCYKAVTAVAVLLYALWVLATPDQYHFISTVNLIFHEAGHTIFSFFGTFTHVAAGSAIQVLIPLICAVAFWRQDDRFAVGLMIIWAGQALGEVAYYAKDAVAMRLDLLGGDDAIHDWNYLLQETGALQYTPYIAYTLYACAVLLIVYGTARALHESFTTQYIADVV